MVQAQVRRRRAEADRLVEEFEASGLSRREWARQAGVSVNTLDLYRKQRGRVGTRETPWKAAAPREVGKAEGSVAAAGAAGAEPAGLKAEPDKAKLEPVRPAEGKQGRAPSKVAGRKAETAQAGSKQSVPAAARAAKPRWIEVRAEARPAGYGTGLRVLSPGGWRVEVEAGFDAATLRRLLQVLETAAPEQG